MLLTRSSSTPRVLFRTAASGYSSSESKLARASTSGKETPGFYESEIRPRALASFILMHPDIDWQVRELPSLPNRSKNLEDLLEDLPLNHQMWWSRQRCDYILGQMSSKHTAQANEMIRGNGVRYGTIFRRVRDGKSMAELRVDGIAGCLRTPRGGSGRQILFVAGKGRFSVRLLTPRECARLMGADEFVLKVSLNQALFGFGDAVCVQVIEWIGKNYLNPVWEENYAKAEKPKKSRIARQLYRKAHGDKREDLSDCRRMSRPSAKKLLRFLPVPTNAAGRSAIASGAFMRFTIMTASRFTLDKRLKDWEEESGGISQIREQMPSR